LDALKESTSGNPVTVVVTGRGRDLLAGVATVNEITASARAARRFAPEVRGMIEIGGHFAKWVQFDDKGEVQDYSLNGLCAAGSGAFLEQQAARLELSISELASLALDAPSGAAIAGRCSVFAKSDMIHQQQKGTPVSEIAYGLCLALARNYAAAVLKGREPVWPVAFIGGAAANPGLLRAFREILGVKEKDILVPENSSLFGALGAALSAGKGSLTLEDLAERVAAPAARAALPATLPPLPEPEPVDLREEQPKLCEDGVIEGFLGVDVGSVSTDFVLLDSEGKVIQGIYLPTRGRPIEAMEEGLAILGEKLGGRAKILAVGTTGSGRHLAAQFLKADLARNEITAQLKSTVHYFPDVDTVFEIGGQDSKYISAQNGSIRDFTMNKICAAGTGSFLEEQAGQLGLSIIGEFEEQALQSRTPADLGSRCTVFMDTELVNALQRGTTVPDAAAGLAYSIAHNYLHKVVALRKVGRCVVFQGGVASNRAVVAALSKVLGRCVKVHPYNRLSGAIGVALIAREAYLEQPVATGFIGFKSEQDYTLKSFECEHCSNMCQVMRMKRGDDLAFFGDVCERYTTGASKKGEILNVPNLCLEREKLLDASLAEIRPRPAEPAPNSAIDRFLTRYGVRTTAETPEDIAARDARGPKKSRGTIGIPRASLYFELLPLWAALFKDLGYEIVLSAQSSKELLAKGVRKLSADACLPVKLAYSHSLDLISEKADFIFLPSILDLPAPFGSPEQCVTCPYTQSLPYMVRSAMKGRFLIPQINMSVEIDGLPEGLESLADDLDVSVHRLRSAYQRGKEAHLEFKASLLRRGDEVLDSRLDWAVVLIGKPYNVYDSFLNLNLVRHLARLGVTAIPYEYISKAGDEHLDESWDELPWRFNRDYIKAALTVRSDARLYPIVVSNFGCGPDGFTIKHLEKILEGRPSLQLEFDEHRGEAGMVTRLEAFLDEIAAHRAKGTTRKTTLAPIRRAPAISSKKRKFYIPYFADHARIYAGILRHYGMEAEVLPPSTDEARRKGEKVSSGKE
ncbi:MAG: acyl-CoA dehydratase activase, partial [Elusimicrobiota bacterium]